MMPTFDLIREPWLPCLRSDGAAEEAGLRDALCRAHELRAVRDPLTTVEFGLYRLLVVLVLDIFRPDDTQMLSDLLEAGRFEAAQVEAYFAQWEDRFDLFSKAHPFLQTPDMDGESSKPLAGLLPPIPSGTNAAHFHHPHEGAFGVSPAAAARLLASVAPFMTAGGAGLAPSINGAPPWYALITGGSLFETLCRNAYVLDRQKIALGRPAWRDDRPLNPGERCKGADLLEGWTWRPRRVQLVPGPPGMCALTGAEADPLVRTMRFSAGASCDFAWRDPAVPYKIDDKGPKVMRPQEGREVWRDTAPLALLNQRDYAKGDAATQFRRPAVIDQIVLMTGDYIEKGPLNLTLYGMRTDLKMKVFEWQRATLSLPRPLVLQDKFHREVQGEMERAGDVAYALRKAVKMTYDREGAGSKAAFDSLVAYAQRRFWADLRPAYDRFLAAVAPLPAWPKDRWEEARGPWWAAIRRSGAAALGLAIGDLDADAGALKRQALAEKSFANSLFTILMAEDEKAARAADKKAKGATKKTKGGTAS